MTELNAQQIGPYRRGEIPAPIVVTFKDFLGNPIDLTGYTAKWQYRQHLAGGWPDFTASDPALVTQTATVLTQTTNKGQVQYTWVAADFTTLGYFEGEMWVGNNGPNRLASIRYLWRTYDALAVPSI